LRVGFVVSTSRHTPDEPVEIVVTLNRRDFDAANVIVVDPLVERGHRSGALTTSAFLDG
jgi:hypothetical protein